MSTYSFLVFILFAVLLATTFVALWKSYKKPGSAWEFVWALTFIAALFTEAWAMGRLNAGI